jgi:hypothetical protein
MNALLDDDDVLDRVHPLFANLLRDFTRSATQNACTSGEKPQTIKREREGPHTRLAIPQRDTRMTETTGHPPNQVNARGGEPCSVK